MTTRAQVIVQSQGTQGPPGIRWRGVYDPTAAYAVRDLVRDDDNNILYICIASVDPNSNFLLTNQSYFDIFSIETARPAGLQWQGDYTTAKEYAIRDLIRNPADNSIYYVKQPIPRLEQLDFTDTNVVELLLQGSIVTNQDIEALNQIAPISTAVNNLSDYTTEISTLSPYAEGIGTVSANISSVNAVSTNLAQGANSEVVIVGDNLSVVNTVATALTNQSSELYTALNNATTASTKATEASASATAAATSESNAATSEANADDAYQDARKLATNPYNTQYTLSDTSTGYSALHYATAASNALADLITKFVGSYATANLPTTNVAVGALAYDTTELKIKAWTGSTWQVGIEGAQGPAGPGILSVSYDEPNERLVIEYEANGTSVAQDPRIGTVDLDFGTHTIKYANTYGSIYSLPSATTYPGMFAVVNGAPAFSHNGSWYAIDYNVTALISN